VALVSVHVSPPAVGWKGATYSITFVATSGISTTANLSANAFAVSSNNGTEFSLSGQITLNDNTNPADSWGKTVCASVSGNGSSISAPSNCFDNPHTNIPAGDSVTITIPGVNNPSTASSQDTLSVWTDNDPTFITSAPYVIEPEGYWLVGSDGGVFTFGGAKFYGSTGNLVLQRPVVGIVSTANDVGYWLDASDGGVFAFGATQFYGSLPGLGIHPAGSGLPGSLNAPIVGMVPSADDRGYFMVGADGGVFAFGDAKFAGSCPGIRGCAGTAVSVIPDASGNGYWLVTNLGAVYAFGDAPYLGGPGNQGTPVTSALRTPDGHGYWILNANGAINNYGDAAALNDNSDDQSRAAAIFNGSDSQGASVAFADGGVTSLGDAPYFGDMAGHSLNGQIIAASGF
jgi:hypothetical protein